MQCILYAPMSAHCPRIRRQGTQIIPFFHGFLPIANTLGFLASIAAQRLAFCLRCEASDLACDLAAAFFDPAMVFFYRIVAFMR
jgi:hypothetical protein